MNKVKRYVLHVAGCVDPYLVGPYASAKTRDAKAIKLRNEDEEDGVFWLNVDNKGNVLVGAYSGGFMEGQPDFPGSEG
jgi:hypothetical protein